MLVTPSVDESSVLIRYPPPSFARHFEHEIYVPVHIELDATQVYRRFISLAFALIACQASVQYDIESLPLSEIIA